MHTFFEQTRGWGVGVGGGQWLFTFASRYPMKGGLGPPPFLPPLHLHPAPLIPSTPLLHQVLQKTRNFFSRPFPSPFLYFAYRLSFRWPPSGNCKHRNSVTWKLIDLRDVRLPSSSPRDQTHFTGFSVTPSAYKYCTTAIDCTKRGLVVRYHSHPERCPCMRSRRVRGIGGGSPFR